MNFLLLADGGLFCKIIVNRKIDFPAALTTRLGLVCAKTAISRLVYLLVKLAFSSSSDLNQYISVCFIRILFTYQSLKKSICLSVSWLVVCALRHISLCQIHFTQINSSISNNPVKQKYTVKLSKTFLFQANQFNQGVLIKTVQFSICKVFVYTQLNVKTVLLQTIQLSISMQFTFNRPTDWDLSGTTTPDQSGLDSDGNEEVRGAYDKFPHFFRMGTFIESTHMKL